MSLLQGRKTKSFPEIPADRVPERFVVKQGKTMLAMGLILIFVFGGAAGQNMMSNGVSNRLDMLAACVFCILAGIVVLVRYKNQRLEVDGEELCYTDQMGRKNQFRVCDIAGVRRDISENPKLLAADGRVLARFDRNMENFAVMIAYLKKYDVTADMI